jgi:transcriptional regulator with XRE-family HTH domain
MNKTVGEVIRETRENLNISQRDLASATRGVVSRRHLSNVELGKTNFSVGKLSAVFSALVRFGA